MFKFPWSNFHELNLDWILEVVKEATEIFINGKSDIQHAVETSEQALEVAEQAAGGVIADGSITIPKLNNEVLKTTAYVIVGNRADEAIPAGAYVYLRKSQVAGLTDGIYTAYTNITAGAIVTPAEFQQSTELHDAGALNVLKNTLDHLEIETETVENGLAIIVDGDTCSVPVPVGGYAYIKNNTHSLAEGLYINTSSSAFPVSGGTADSTMFTAVSGGGLNDLKNTIPQVVNNLTTTSTTNALSAAQGKMLKDSLDSSRVYLKNFTTTLTANTEVQIGVDLSEFNLSSNGVRVVSVAPTFSQILDSTYFLWYQRATSSTGVVLGMKTSSSMTNVSFTLSFIKN